MKKAIKLLVGLLVFSLFNFCIAEALPLLPGWEEIDVTPSPLPFFMNYPPIVIDAVPEPREDEHGHWLFYGNATEETVIQVTGGMMGIAITLNNNKGDPVDVAINDGRVEGLDGLENGEYTLIAYCPLVPEISPRSKVLIIDRSKTMPDDAMPTIVWQTHVPEPTPTTEPVMQTGEITDSREEIIAAIDDGSAKQRYAVGATKELNLGNLGVIHMQLAGFDLDQRADRQGKAATTWIAVELLPERKRMNEEMTNAGGWQASDLREYLQDTVLPAIPLLIRQHIISVVKRQRAAGKWQTTEETVWIPDYEEVFGDNALYYGLFLNKKENCVKHRQGSAGWWWLRSADFIGFSCVSNGGSDYYFNADVSGGVALGFCL